MTQELTQESHSQDQIIYKGKEITKNPTISRFVEELDEITEVTKRKLLSIFSKEMLHDISELFTYSISKLEKLGIKKIIALKIADHLRFLQQGHELIISPIELLKADFNYLSTGIPEVDKLFSYASGNTGLRSKSLIEIYGESGSGKTQLMMMLCIMALKKEINHRKYVLYIDSEQALDIHRLFEIAEYHGIDHDLIRKYLLVAKPQNFDQVEQVLTGITSKLREIDLGLVILDSIIDPLKAQYPIGDDYQNLQERQQHLKQVTDQMKSLAMMHNFTIVYTNQVRSDINGSAEVIAQGGHTLSHASDIRLYFRRIRLEDITAETVGKSPSRAYLHQIERDGHHLSELKLVNAGYLPIGATDLIIGKHGVQSINRLSTMMEIDKDDKLEVKNQDNTNEDMKQEIVIDSIEDELY